MNWGGFMGGGGGELKINFFPDGDGCLSIRM